MCRFKSSLPARGAGPFPASAEASGAARARRPLREPAPGRAASPAGRGGARGKRARPAEPGGQGRARGEAAGERGPGSPGASLAPIGSHPAPRTARRGAVSERAGGGGAERRLRAPYSWPGPARLLHRLPGVSLAPFCFPLLPLLSLTVLSTPTPRPRALISAVLDIESPWPRPRPLPFPRDSKESGLSPPLMEPTAGLG